MKGFGFPTSGINGGNTPYRADTSQNQLQVLIMLDLAYSGGGGGQKGGNN